MERLRQQLNELLTGSRNPTRCRLAGRGAVLGDSLH